MDRGEKDYLESLAAKADALGRTEEAEVIRAALDGDEDAHALIRQAIGNAVIAREVGLPVEFVAFARAIARYAEQSVPDFRPPAAPTAGPCNCPFCRTEVN